MIYNNLPDEHWILKRQMDYSAKVDLFTSQDS
jgi:hypothetical protein